MGSNIISLIMICAGGGLMLVAIIAGSLSGNDTVDLAAGGLGLLLLSVVVYFFPKMWR